MKNRQKTLALLVAAALAAVPLLTAVPAQAADTLTITSTQPVTGTVDIKYEDGRSETSVPLWTGSIPTGVRIPAPKTTYSSSCSELTFAIQASLSYDEMSDVDIDFEIWSTAGVKVMSDSIYSGSQWNPSGGPTQIAALTCEPFADGKYNLYVTTQYQLSTDGLLTYYQEGKQTLSFSVSRAKFVKCKKGYTTKIVAKTKCPSGWKKVKA